MQITALILFALSCVSASPVKRQASSAADSIVASATSAIASVTASSAAPSASASQDFASGLLAALRDRQATTLATLVEPLAGTLGPILSAGEWTIFAPGNEYLANVDTSNQTALVEILQYHIVAGNYPASALQENVSNIATTLHSATSFGSNYTTLPLAFTQNVFGTTVVNGQNGTSVLGNATYENILIKLIDGVLIPPGNVVNVSREQGANVLISTLEQFLPPVVQTLESAQGITVFSPNNAAIQGVQSTLAPLLANSTSAESVSTAVQGHVIPSIVFSTNITDGLQTTSLSGSTLSFINNATGVFVTGNGVTAQITQPDLIASNGVVHIIDAVLFSDAANAPIVASASGAASSVVAATSGVAQSASAAVASILPTSA